MSQFIGDFKYTKLTKKWYMLERDLVFAFTLGNVLEGYDEELRTILTATGFKQDTVLYVIAPEGFVTDFASVPVLLQWLYPPDGDYAAAAGIHDIIYQSLKANFPVTGHVGGIDILNVEHTQLLADRIFLYAMIDLDVNYITRSVLYKAVRAFGSGSYGGLPMAEDYGIDSLYRSSPRSEPFRVYRDQLERGVTVGMTRMKSSSYRFHAVKFANLKRSFVYATL